MKGQNEYRMPPEWKNFGYKPIAFDFAEDVLFICLIYPTVILTLQFFDKGIAVYFAPLLLLAGFMATTINRRYTKRLPLFVVLELVINIFVIIAAFTVAAKVTLAVIMIIMSGIALSQFIYAVKISKNSHEHGENQNFMLFRNGTVQVSKIYDHEEKRPFKQYLGNGVLLFGTLILYATFLVALKFNIQRIPLLCGISIVVSLILFEIYIHFSGTVSLIGNASEYSASSIKKIRRLNYIFVVCAVVVVALTTLLIYEIYHLLGLSRIDHFFTSFEGTPLPPIINPGGTTSTSSAIPFKPPVVSNNGSVFFNALSVLLSVISWSLAIIGVIFVILGIIGVINHFFRTKKTGDEESQSVFSMKEAAQQFKKILGRLRSFAVISGKPNNVRVRKIYYRFINNRIKSGLKLSPSDTPTEIDQKIDQSPNTAATKIYEKARYGPNDCADEDVDLIKKTLR